MSTEEMVIELKSKEYTHNPIYRSTKKTFWEKEIKYLAGYQSNLIKIRSIDPLA